MQLPVDAADRHRGFRRRTEATLEPDRSHGLRENHGSGIREQPVLHVTLRLIRRQVRTGEHVTRGDHQSGQRFPQVGCHLVLPSEAALPGELQRIT
jgi:hypothetical protein